jgi:hypothetical protein
MKRLGILLLFSFVSVILFGQKSVSFTASTNASKVVKGGVFEVIFSIKNASGSDFTPPRFSGVEVMGGPNLQSSRTIINGDVSQATNYGYYLRAAKTGTIIIDAATIKVDGKTLKTKPLKIEVANAPSKSELANTKDIFIKTDLAVENAYVGQQVIVTFTIFSTKKVLKANLVDVPKFSNGFTQYLDISQFSAGIEVYNGKQYYTIPAAKYALIPQKEGDLNIEGLTVELKVLEDNGAFQTAVGKEIVSQIKTLNVIPLKNKPADFTNAVGEFEFEALLTKSEISMDESTTLTLSVTGTGDAKAIEIPRIKGLESHFEVYEPTINSVVKDEVNQFVTQKIFTYLLVPKKTGKLSYTPTFTYFNTNTKQFETLENQAFNFTIKKGSGNGGKNESKNFEDDGERDIHTIFATTNFKLGKPNFFGSTTFWALMTLPFLGLFIALGIKQKRKKEAAINPILVKMSKADKIAMQHLAKAENHWKNNEERAFYEAISKALWGYMSDKLVIPQAALSKENIRLKLAEKQVPIQNIEAFMKVLNTCEMAVFAKLGTNMETVYNDAKNVIVIIENTLEAERK